jgi:hypothetical protein
MVRLSLALFPVLFVLGCQMTPEEVNRIQVENELLREQVRIIRQNCSYYRDLQLEVEDDAEVEE